MEGTISRLEITFLQADSLSLLKSSTLKIYIRDQVKALQVPSKQHPFSSPAIFDIEGLSPGEPLLLSLEEKNEEVGIGDFKALAQEQWVSLTAKDRPDCGRIKFAVALNADDSPKRPGGSPLLENFQDCPRCSYLQKISESQQNELMSLEEHKATYADIKQIIKEYYSVDHIPYATKYIPDIEELGIELPAPYHGKSSQITKQEAEHLKDVILGLADKLKVLQQVQEEVKSLRQQLYESHVNRLNLQTTIKETTEGLEAKCKEQCKKHLEVNEERSKAMQDLLHQQHIFAQKSLELDQLKSDLSTLNATLQQLKAEEFNFNTMKEHMSRLESEFKESTSKCDELKNEHIRTLEAFAGAKSRQSDNILRLTNEKFSLQKEIESIETQITEQKDVNSALTKTNSGLDDEIKQLEGEINGLIEENKAIEHSKHTASEKEETCIKLHREIYEAAKKFEAELEDLSRVNTQLLKEKSIVVDDLNKLENVLENKTEEVQDLTRTNYSSLAQSIILEQQISIQNDQFEIQKALEAQTEINEKIKAILLEEIATMGEQLKKQSEECVAISKSVEQQKKVLDDRVQEKAELGRIVEELKKVSPMYVAVRGEQIDELLAQVLNSRKDWLNVEIKREEEGKYRFGSKEIGLFIEENQLMVRSGKAIMGVEEFLITYIPLELHKKQLNKS
jgi:DNA repair exonuclease SbcCD ATPase subunit